MLIHLKFDTETERGAYLGAAARLRGISRKHLLDRVVNKLLDDQLILAVMDDGARFKARPNKTPVTIMHPRVSDEVIYETLNDEWHTPGDIHRALDRRGECSAIGYALERMARAGKIQNKHEAVMESHDVPVCINYYRKLQRPNKLETLWPK